MSIEFDFSGQNPDFQKALLSAGFAPFSGVGGSRSAFAPSFATFAPQQQNQAPASPFTAQTGENFAGDGDSAGDGRGEHGFFGDAVSPDFGSFARSVAGIPGMMSGVGMAAAVASPFARSMLGMPQVSNVSLTGVVKDVLGIPSISSIFGLDPAPTASPFGHSPSISQDDIGEPNTPAQDVDIASQVDSFSELGDPAGSQAAADQAAGTTGAQGGDANGDASDGDAASDTGADGSDGQSSEGGNGPGDFAGGGYTGAGPIDEVAGRVHRNEYVIPADMVAENPRFIQEIETARRAREYTHQPHVGLTPRQEAIRSAVGNSFMSMIPGVGDVMDAKEGYDTLREAGGDFERGDYLSGIGNTLSGAAIGASAAIPFLGIGGIKRAVGNVEDAMAAKYSNDVYARADEIAAELRGRVPGADVDVLRSAGPVGKSAYVKIFAPEPDDAFNARAAAREQEFATALADWDAKGPGSGRGPKPDKKDFFTGRKHVSTEMRVSDHSTGDRRLGDYFAHISPDAPDDEIAAVIDSLAGRVPWGNR